MAYFFFLPGINAEKPIGRLIPLLVYVLFVSEEVVGGLRQVLVYGSRFVRS